MTDDSRQGAPKAPKAAEAPKAPRTGGDGPSGRGLAGGILPIVLVLAVPFLLRPRDNLIATSGESVVVITPHTEPVRYEFAHAFREHMRAKVGKEVTIDWRTPGSSREISRFIASEYETAFANHWKNELHRPWSAKVASAFADPSVRPSDGDDGDEVKEARRAFLGSNVGIGIDLLFGTGSVEAVAHASAGRLVDSGVLRAHPELFGEGGIPEIAGGKVLWDAEGRWLGSCLTGFGICYNRDTLARLGAEKPPEQWTDLADPRYFSQLGIADPTKSGAAASAFEMVVHQQMNLREAELRRDPNVRADEIETRARREGWERSMRLVRRISGNARYFLSQGTQSALEIATGDAAAGMCIDFYGRFQSEVKGGGAGRLSFVTPHGGTAIDTDPIALLRGAPHRDLAVQFMEFVLSTEGQKLWNFRVGVPGGPVRYALRRLPIAPALYAPPFDSLRSDPEENPYEEARAFVYHREWTGPLLRVITFILKTTCLDAHDELKEAHRALIDAHFPKEATALFDDVHVVDYEAAQGPIRAALASGDPTQEATLGNRLLTDARAQYRRVTALAREGR
ncbi:MAG: extracellular solute-binding protein [Polyangiaceae bacterium]